MIRKMQILGHTIRVKQVKHLMRDHNAYAQWSHDKLLIEVQAPKDDIEVSHLEQAFWHEVTHAVLDLTGYPKLSANEKLVDRFAQGLYQAIKTIR
jgi:hypothetical protein